VVAPFLAGMVFGQSLRTVLIGIVLGGAGFPALARFVQSLLFGVTAPAQRLAQ